MRAPEELFIQVTCHMGHTAVGCKAMCLFVVASLHSGLQQVNGFWQVNPLTTPRKLMALSVTETEASAVVLEGPE